MITASRVESADYAEELSAGMSLKLATTKDELVSLWFRDCDHFEGEQRARLLDVYAEKLTEFAPMQRAG
jgi:hypothetical protein